MASILMPGTLCASTMSAEVAAAAVAAVDDNCDACEPNKDAFMCSAVTCERNSGVSVSSLAGVTIARLERTLSDVWREKCNSLCVVCDA